MNELFHSLKATDYAAAFDRFMAAQEMPWVFAAALLAILALWLWRRASRLAGDNARLGKALGASDTRTAVLEERLDAQQEVMARETDNHRRRVDSLSNDILRMRELLRQERESRADRERDAASKESMLREQVRSANDKLALLEQAEQRLNASFENLANRIFDEKHEKFNDASRQGVETLLTPVRQQLQDFRRRVDEVYDREHEQRTTLRSEIEHLRNLNLQISQDAVNLANALKGDSKQRGNWGEVQLERLLESSGLHKGREYDLQVSLKDTDDKLRQPDAVVRLPENKVVIIDSKVALVAYEAYHGAEDDADRERLLRSHIAALKTHVRQLSEKKYDELAGIRSLDMVIMFVPIEPALLLALEHEPGLYNEAFEKGVVLVSPTLLLTTLRIIHNIWRYEYQNRNAIDIADEAGKLYDQFVRFTDSLEKIGDQLRKAGESYETARRQLVDGKGNLVRRTERMKELGAKARKSMQKELLEQAIESDSEHGSRAANGHASRGGFTGTGQ